MKELFDDGYDLAVIQDQYSAIYKEEDDAITWDFIKKYGDYARACRRSGKYEMPMYLSNKLIYNRDLGDIEWDIIDLIRSEVNA